MRARWQIGSGVPALVAAVLALGGCGGDSGGTVAGVKASGARACEVYGFEGALLGLKAGVSATEREFNTDSVPAGREERRILRGMKENIALLHHRLRNLEDCVDGAPQEAEGEPAHKSSSLRLPEAGQTVIGDRLGPARVEPGDPSLPASPCGTSGKNGITTIYIFPESAHCARVAPGERLLFINDTGIGPQHAEAAAIRILVGNYELWLGLDEEGLIPAPVDAYLGRGSHRVHVAGAPGPTILLLPRLCAIGRSASSPGSARAARRTPGRRARPLRPWSCRGR
jgi:hypothetical protein